MTPELQKKIDFAIRLLKAYDDPQNPVEIAYSGGKDSDVILQLAKEAGINFRAIYKNTTIDPPGTIKHVKDMVWRYTILVRERPSCTSSRNRVCPVELAEPAATISRSTRF